MSRFYDALKHASGTEFDIKLVEDRFSTDRASEFTQEAVNGTGTPVMAEDAPPSANPWAISPEQDRFGRRKESVSAFGSLRGVTSDRAARILPNAVNSSVVEHYRRLRTKIIQQHGLKPFKSLLVTSASPQEGKSVTVVNLALSFAMLPSFRILLVDGDMRRGTLGTWFGATDRPGLSEILEGTCGLEDAIFKCEDAPVHFMGRGKSTTSPGELLHSPQLSSHFRDMTEQFDLVLVDSPPATLLTDTQLLAANCDAVLLVTRAFATSRKTLEKVVQELAPFRLIGTVLNGGTENTGRYSEGYYTGRK